MITREEAGHDIYLATGGGGGGGLVAARKPGFSYHH